MTRKIVQQEQTFFLRLSFFQKLAKPYQLLLENFSGHPSPPIGIANPRPELPPQDVLALKADLTGAHHIRPACHFYIYI
jgi:hypothetical protein